MATRKTSQEPQSEGAALLDIAGVAERLGVTVRYVRRLVAERRIPYIKLGGPIRFDPAEVERFIDEARRPALAAGPVATVSRTGRRRASRPPRAASSR